MRIRLISSSHKTAPLEVRELFAFTKEKQAELGRILREEGGAAESVIIATCNRTEIYTYFDAAQDKKKNVCLNKNLHNPVNFAKMISRSEPVIVGGKQSEQ